MILTERSGKNRSDRGALNTEVKVSYRICFLSARPIRQALAKTILASQHENTDQLVKQLQAFVERDFSSYIVIAVTIDSDDRRVSGPMMQAINSGTTGILKNRTFLERQDGKRLFLMEYLTPIADNLGAARTLAAVRVNPVLWLRSVTLPATMTAPVGSVTAPRIAPVTSARRRDPPANTAKNTNSHNGRVRFIDDLLAVIPEYFHRPGGMSRGKLKFQ